MFLFPSARTPGMDLGGGWRGCALLLPWECSWQLVFCKIWRYVFSAIKRHLLRRECFHSRGQHLCKFIGTKGSVCIRRVQLPEDCFGTPTWPPFHCFGTPIWPPWRHVKTLHSLLKFVYVTSQLRHSLVLQPLLRKVLDPSLNSLNSLNSLSKGGHVQTFWTLREGAYSRLGAF